MAIATTTTTTIQPIITTAIAAIVVVAAAAPVVALVALVAVEVGKPRIIIQTTDQTLMLTDLITRATTIVAP